jgi:formate dehydrogenase maturation protein FdhE
VRDVEKELLQLAPVKPLPQEIKKQVSPTHMNVNFLMSEGLEHKLEAVRSLLGPEGHKMTLSELIEQMADLSLQQLKEKKFGKSRVRNFKTKSYNIASQIHEPQNINSKNLDVQKGRYISAALKFSIWTRDKGHCTKCESQRNLNYDHIRPMALGGSTDANNLRLLCFNCNQRSRIEARL